MMCAGCANYRKQMKTLRRIMQAYAEGSATAVDPGLGRDG
jgi:hypothetical protein